MEYALWAAIVREIRKSTNVLILILMEYALWDKTNAHYAKDNINVLILILMEYALWDHHECPKSRRGVRVLILILMEYALWGNIINN